MKILTLAAVLLCVPLYACNQQQQTPDDTKGLSDKPAGNVSLHSELGGNAAGFERACGPRQFVFPDDHGDHPSFRNEWWYITGNLTSDIGQQFGFHVTFFRIANEPLSPKAKTDSHWGTNEFYMAHFALSVDGGEIQTYERFARSAAGLAGAETTPAVKVWLDDWQLTATEHQNDLTDDLIWHLTLNEADTRLKLSLTPSKPLVLQGDSGYSQKSADPCNASYYYSYSRLKTNGELQLAGNTYQVSGNSWLDREWSSSALGDNQSGWDWFAIQLDDGTDMMLYHLRRNDGDRDSFSHAVEIDPKGNAREIPIENIQLTITRWWTGTNGNRYPVAGEILRHDTQEVIVFEPLIDDQELDLTVRYWEGAILLASPDGRHLGRGYMELTGY